MIGQHQETQALGCSDSRIIFAQRQDADHHNQASGSRHLVPSQGVVLVVTDDQGNEICFGFMKYPSIIRDVNGKPIVETGTSEAWAFRTSLTNQEPLSLLAFLDLT